MQSTLNTAALPVRPKVGRPPLELVTPSSPPPAPVKEHKRFFTWRPRVAAFTFALAIALLLVISRVIVATPQEMVTAQAPSAAAAAKRVAGPSPIVGALTPLQPERSVPYTPQNQQPVIDNVARQRLLSILSKD